VKRLAALFLFLVMIYPATAQEDFYDQGKIQDIRIIFHVKNWKHVMDSIFTASGGSDRLFCDIVINGQLLENAGIRYKGYSSVNLKDVKNPFNIDLAYTRHHKNYQGFTSLRLSNVNYDPSFIREALSYEIARKYMPASRANFANVYVNDTLLGLYSNVEAVNKNFITRFFPEKVNAFIKGSPATLEYPFGQNANLADAHGTDSTAYEPYYELESDYGWSDLYHFITVLNQQPDSVARVLNVDRALWMHAFNYALLNIDSYIGYSQNYYMYKDDNGLFNTIPWDMNMSFGSFRHSDGSTHFNGLTIPQTKTLDPLGLLAFAVSPRPLFTKLLKNDTLKRMFLAHMRTIVEENFSNNDYYTRGAYLQGVIDSAVKADTNKFYSYASFPENLNNTVGSSGSNNEFPGLKDLIEARTAYLATYPGFSGAPVILEQKHGPEFPVRKKEAWISVHAMGAHRVFLGYRYRFYDAFTRVAMSDDGNHHDSVAGDGIYGASIIPSGPVIQYYFYAENDSAGIFSPARAEYNFYTIQPSLEPGDVTLNEVMISSRNDVPVYAGENGPWIEFCNNTSENLHLTGVHLSDDQSEPLKWAFPDTVITGRSYLVVWADGDTTWPGLHCNFYVKPTGGWLTLTSQNGKPLDSVFIANPAVGKSIGRYPNGRGPFTYMNPSKEACNFIGTTPETGMLIYPSPARDQVTVEIKNVNQGVTFGIFNTNGQMVRSRSFGSSMEMIPALSAEMDISGLPAGIWYVRATSNDKVLTKAFAIY